jgi:hypothetical protein
MLSCYACILIPLRWCYSETTSGHCLHSVHPVPCPKHRRHNIPLLETKDYSFVTYYITYIHALH